MCTAVPETQKAAVKKALAFVDIYAPQASAKKVHAFLQQREDPMDAATSTSPRLVFSRCYRRGRAGKHACFYVSTQALWL